MSKTKGGGSTRNGRDSNAQRLGVKVYDGTVVTAGCTEWPAALAAGDPHVETITRTILDRLG